MLGSEKLRDIESIVQFSNAHDIVELIVLTGDDAFLQTLRDAVGASRRLWHVPTADKVGDLLVAGQVGILVLDTQVVADTAAVFIAQIKRQFPDLVVVVAGTRDTEGALAGLISSGVIYRFIHKPMSPARAKLFADAAVKKYQEQLSRVIPGGRSAKTRMGLSLAVVPTVVLLAVCLFWVTHRYSNPPPPVPTAVVARRETTRRKQQAIPPTSANNCSRVRRMRCSRNVWMRPRRPSRPPRMRASNLADSRS